MKHALHQLLTNELQQGTYSVIVPHAYTYAHAGVIISYIHIMVLTDLPDSYTFSSALGPVDLRLLSCISGKSLVLTV